MAATAAMKASLVLNFEDKLSSGLSKLEQQLDKLKQLGREQGLGKLENAFEDLQRSAVAARDLAGELRGVGTATKEVGTAAKGAYADLKRMTGAYADIQKQRAFTRNDAAMLWGGPRAAERVGGERGGAGGMMAGLGSLAAGYGIMKSSRAYADFEDIARRAAITKGLSGAALEADDKRLQALFSRDALATGQSGTNIGEAYLDLAGMGIAPGEVERLLPIHSRVATAYGISPEALSPATAALNQSFKVSDEDMAGALAAMATATKEGRFKIEDFARQLPMIGGQMNLMGMTGRGGANTAFAALETVAKNSTDPSSAAANFYDALRYITAPMAARAFRMKGQMVPAEIRDLMRQSQGLYGAAGIDLPKLLITAEKQGINPLDAVVAKLAQLGKGKSPVEAAELFGALLHNQQAGVALASLVQHKDEFVAMRRQLGAVNEGTLDRDFQSRMAGSKVQMQLFDEQLAQLNRHFGEGFAPLVKGAVYALGDLNSAFTGLNQIVPGLGDDVAAVGGAALGVGAAFGAIRLVMPSLGEKVTSVGGKIAQGMLEPAKLFVSEIKAGATAFDTLMMAVGGCDAAMEKFNQTTMRNPLIRTGVFMEWVGEDLYKRMHSGTRIDTIHSAAAGSIRHNADRPWLLRERGSGIRRAPWPRHEPADERPHSFGWRRRCARAAAGHR